MQYKFYISSNNKNIKFNIDKDVQSFKFNSNSSYLDKILYKQYKQKNFFDNQFLIKIQCYENLKKEINNKYKSFFDLFGGVGITAKIFETNIKETFVNDYDNSCYNILLKNFYNKNVYNENAFQMKYKNKYDLILADFNDLTLKRSKGKYFKVLKDIFNYSNKYVILNDCSVFSLKFGSVGYQNYSNLLGFDIGSTHKSFFKNLKRYYENLFPLWQMYKIEYYNDSSFILFKKTKKKLNLLINKVFKEDLKNNKPLIFEGEL